MTLHHPRLRTWSLTLAILGLLTALTVSQVSAGSARVRSHSPARASMPAIYMSGLTSLASAIGIVAIGVSFLMISGEFDLSVGAVFAISAVLFGKFLSDAHFVDMLALVAVLAIAAVSGW